MLGYTIRRLLWVIPVVWVIATLTFFLMQAGPGGPFTQDKQRPPAVERAIEEKYGLDDPVWRQYVRYMSNLARGDLGISFYGDRDVSEVLRREAFITGQIAFLSLIVAVMVGITLGTISALNHNGPLDYLGVLFATVGASVPNFVLAAFLVILFAIEMPWFQTLGWGGPNEWRDTFNLGVYEWRKMVLPVIALSTLPAAYIARVTRASMLEVLHQDYVRTARAKGLSEYSVVVRHAVKNALIPVLTVIGPIATVLVSGSFIIETMFSVPGIGQESVRAITRRDYGLIMGIALFFAFSVAIVNLVVDLLYAVIDPRIRYS